MTARPNLINYYTEDSEDTEFICPHCNTLQATIIRNHNFNAFWIRARQCKSCRDVEIELRFEDKWTAIYPGSRPWPGENFAYAPIEVRKSYDDARTLYTIHTGAAGAYARRALELLLDNAGYSEKTLDAAIKAAKAENNPDKRLPKRLLQKLDYIREIGNFALHTRRDSDLVIVEISDEEVAACLETVEELIAHIYEEPVEDYLRTVDLNKKLSAAGKKLIELPILPPGISIGAITQNPADEDI